MAQARWAGRLGVTIFAASIATIVSTYSAAGSGSPSNGEVSDVSRAALKTRDAPPGYNHRYVKIYSKYQATMKVGDLTCAAEHSVTSRNWKQGLAAELQKKGVIEPSSLAECIYLLNSDSAARQDYVQGLASLARLKSQQSLTALSVPRVGDQRQALYIANGFVWIYALLFRHHNAVVFLEYSSNDKQDLSLRAYRTLAVSIDSRLH